MPTRRSAGSAAFVAALTAVAGCAGDGKTLREPVFDPPAVVEPVPDDSGSAATAPVSAAPESTLPVDSVTTAVPASSAPVSTGPSDATNDATADGGRIIEVDRLYSPANATAEANGSGAVPTDPVTVDGEPADVLSFVEDAGSFVLQVRIDDEGAHTVCVVDTCGRVYTLAADAETPDEVNAKIEEAIPVATGIVGSATEFPDWTIEIGGPLSGTGGTTDIEQDVITIYRNRGRSVDDFVRTILHEFGHVADHERLDDAERARYFEVRGIDPGFQWSDPSGHRLDQWERQPSEDFAEAMAMYWSGGRWEPRTFAPLPAPTPEQLDEIAALAEIG